MLRQKGSHVRMQHEDGRVVTIPVHVGKNMSNDAVNSEQVKNTTIKNHGIELRNLVLLSTAKTAVESLIFFLSEVHVAAT